ncbi:MAG: hypothetical protein VB036_06470 [Propionicimonas sp.]|nr:hypothetical protein [Propionicimonas sp.]
MAREAAVRQVDVRAAGRMAFADAALAVAGHEVTDPMLRALAESAARHEMSSEDAIAAARRHVQG